MLWEGDRGEVKRAINGFRTGLRQSMIVLQRAGLDVGTRHSPYGCKFLSVVVAIKGDVS